MATALACSGCYEGIDDSTEILPRVKATPEAVCDVKVTGIGTLDLDSDDLPDATGKPLWNTQTAGTVDPVLIMQRDGNSVLYDGAGTPLWHTSAHGYDGAMLRVEDDGNVIVWDGWTALWRAR